MFLDICEPQVASDDHWIEKASRCAFELLRTDHSFRARYDFHKVFALPVIRPSLLADIQEQAHGHIGHCPKLRDLF